VAGRPVASRGNEADALVDDLDAQLARVVALDLERDLAVAAVLHRVRDQLGDGRTERRYEWYSACASG
jgi:hypothetical protein